MNRRIAVISSVAVGLLLSVATLAVLWGDKGVSKLTVSFVNAETSYGPPFSNVECERLAFAVRNEGRTAVPFEVFDIKDERGNWFKSRPVDVAAAGQTTHLYLYVPKGSHLQAVRLCGYRKASTIEKAQTAVKMLIEKVSGRYTGKQVWFEKLSVPAYEFIVKIDRKAETAGAANRGQRVGPGPNITSAGAGSGR